MKPPALMKAGKDALRLKENTAQMASSTAAWPKLRITQKTFVLLKNTLTTSEQTVRH